MHLGQIPMQLVERAWDQALLLNALVDLIEQVMQILHSYRDQPCAASTTWCCWRLDGRADAAQQPQLKMSSSPRQEDIDALGMMQGEGDCQRGAW